MGRPPAFHSDIWPSGRLAQHRLPAPAPGGAATGSPADPEPAPMMGGGDHDAAGHAEARRGGSGCGLVGRAVSALQLAFARLEECEERRFTPVSGPLRLRFRANRAALPSPTKHLCEHRFPNAQGAKPTDTESSDDTPGRHSSSTSLHVEGGRRESPLTTSSDPACRAARLHDTPILLRFDADVNDPFSHSPIVGSAAAVSERPCDDLTFGHAPRGAPGPDSSRGCADGAGAPISCRRLSPWRPKPGCRLRMTPDSTATGVDVCLRTGDPLVSQGRAGR